MVVLCLLIAFGGTAGCAYEYSEPIRTPSVATEPVNKPALDPTPVTASPQAYIDPLILEREVRNYAELDRLLKAVPGPALLFEEGPLDGPVRGFGTMAEVPAAGQYTVTAACVGATGAKVSVGQEHPGAPFQPVELALDCAGATSQDITLEQGYIFAHLVLPGPGDTPWTGAVGGVRVTDWAQPRSRALTGWPLGASSSRKTTTSDQGTPPKRAKTPQLLWWPVGAIRFPVFRGRLERHVPMPGVTVVPGIGTATAESSLQGNDLSQIL
ncbi:hypothetical protein AHiyo6_14470 [Arthrobacter sp. Hiyo6]|nr:hypothetical protein AHiyo6_14470 [Arthrobacter sp. Hiyo6]